MQYKHSDCFLLNNDTCDDILYGYCVTTDATDPSKCEE